MRKRRYGQGQFLMRSLPQGQRPLRRPV